MLGRESGGMCGSVLGATLARKLFVVQCLNYLSQAYIIAAFSAAVIGYATITPSPFNVLILVLNFMSYPLHRWYHSNTPPQERLVNDGVLRLSWPPRRHFRRVNHLDLASRDIEHITIRTWNGVADEFCIYRHGGSPVILRNVQEPEEFRSTLTSLPIRVNDVPMSKLAWLLHHNLALVILAIAAQSSLLLVSLGMLANEFLAWTGVIQISTPLLKIVAWSSPLVGGFLALNGIYTLKLRPLYLATTTPPFLLSRASLVANGILQVLCGVVALLISAELLIS
jgi:hypothetical protein